MDALLFMLVMIMSDDNVQNHFSATCSETLQVYEMEISLLYKKVVLCSNIALYTTGAENMRCEYLWKLLT